MGQGGSKKSPVDGIDAEELKVFKDIYKRALETSDTETLKYMTYIIITFIPQGDAMIKHFLKEEVLRPTCDRMEGPNPVCDGIFGSGTQSKRNEKAAKEFYRQAKSLKANETL